ncbi:hypothetical protein [Phaeodactylibacter xiamenensis]|jgi:hypothetical protein|uniref:hypothetical protein n=1 Tax=Phaeodactylibacter xiamenensis TaxID=1524460 RepID=UPI003CCC1BAA
MKYLKLTIGLLFAAFLTMSSLLQAQDKFAVAVAPFSYSHATVSAVEAERISKQVTAIITSANRLSVVNRNSLIYIDKERELQKTVDFIDGETVQQGVSKGAQYMIVGHVINAKGEQGEIVHLSVVNVETTEIIASEVLSKEGSSPIDVATGLNEDLIGDVTNLGSNSTALRTGVNILKEIATEGRFEKEIENFIDRHFPLQLRITKHEEVSTKKGVESVLVYYKNQKGLKKGDRFDIIEQEIVNNPDGTTGKLEEVLGQMQIQSFNGDYIRFKVRSGGENLIGRENDEKVFLKKQSK